jgi:hypothetical protein
MAEVKNIFGAGKNERNTGRLLGVDKQGRI